MSWTYEPYLNEYDKEVTQDTSTPDRWTFRRYMYFKPDSYDDWSTGKYISSNNYSFDLITASEFPKVGDPCPENVKFYVSAIISIKNLSSEEHGPHASYCQVTVEYENIKKKVTESSSVSSGNPNRQKAPWKRPVEDFTVISQEISKPLTWAYNVVTKNWETPATTAGQPFYDLTDSYFIQRATWTYATKDNEDYSLDAPCINKSTVKLFKKFEVPAQAGLLLPPAYRKLYWSKDGSGDGEAYHEWSFEILIDTTNKHLINIINAGTKCFSESNLVDICSWYVYDPSGKNEPKKNYGSYNDMMKARAEVHSKNKTIANESEKLQWYGDFVQTPIPLNDVGEIDTSAIQDPKKVLRLKYCSYYEDNWNLGMRD